MKIEKPEPKYDINPEVFGRNLIDFQLEFVETVARETRMKLKEQALEGKLTQGQILLSIMLLKHMVPGIIGCNRVFDDTVVTDTK